MRYGIIGKEIWYSCDNIALYLIFRHDAKVMQTLGSNDPDPQYPQSEDKFLTSQRQLPTKRLHAPQVSKQIMQWKRQFQPIFFLVHVTENLGVLFTVSPFQCTTKT
jgi:hypothetical protein